MKLLTRKTDRSRLRRAAWIRWLPPIPARSPSPAMMMTFMSGRITLTPQAKAIARPWVVWRVSHRKYGLGIHDEHPMPVTQTISRGSTCISSMAWAKALSTVPPPQPTQKVVGNTSCRR
jgi:hypothetical protein